MPFEETRDLIEALSATACTPLAAAESAPPDIYNHQGFHQLERERVFRGQWQCAGLAAEIPKAGDYLTFDIDGDPVFCIRTRAGEVRSFANVCRHRMMVLLSGRGNAGRIVCPYHAWTYDDGGALIGAPRMADRQGFNKNAIRLPEVRTEIWQGWIYITLDQDVPPVAQQLAALDPLTGPYGAHTYVPVASQDHVWRANWKLLCENFMEGYHLPHAHKATVGQWFVTEDTVFPEQCHEAFTYQTFSKSGDAGYGVAHKDNQRLSARWRRTSVMPTVFPAHMYVLAPDHLWYLSLRPRGTDEVAVRFGAALAPEVHAALDDPDASIGELTAFFDTVNAEDRMVVEGIARGARSTFARSGPLNWLEREIHDFMNYLARRMSV